MNKFHAKKRFGQHLLRYADDARRIASLLVDDSSDSSSNLNIVEVGPGTGELTAAIVEMYPDAKLTAVEFDRDLHQELAGRFKKNPNVSFIQEDILNFDLATLGSEIHLIGNLPYNLSSPIMQWTNDMRGSVVKAVFMLQREVANRICSSPQSKDWSPMAIHSQLRFAVTAGFDLAPDRFNPPPKVHSSVFTLTPRNTAVDFPGFDEDSADKFVKLVRDAFSSRRKTLLNNLSGKWNKSRAELEAVLSSEGHDERIRAEQLSITEFIKLLKSIMVLN